MQELKSPELYIDREISWLEFNGRVLEEAVDPANPLLERFRFASITVSNLDEFFMVRVASLKREMESGNRAKGAAAHTPFELLLEVSERVHSMISKLYETIHQELLPQAAGHGVVIHSYDSLNPKQRNFIERRFELEIFPVMTPMAIDPKHPFPLLSNLSLNIAVMLAPEQGGDKPRFALVPIPSVLSRLLPLPSSPESHEFVLLEEIVRRFLSRLFPGQEIREHAILRIARDAEMEFDDEGSPDLVQEMEGELRKRRTNPPVRLEVEKGISETFLSVFQKLLRIKKEEIYTISGFLDCRFLMTIADLPGLDHLRNKPFPPQIPPEFEHHNLWTLLRNEDVILHHPYESFDPVAQLVSQAADDPDVLAIKQTLYRTSGDSPVVRSLARAALNGKQVAVLVELMARFDEERNIGWARHLEKSGVHVIYGLVGLKTHAKILLIVRREKDGIRRYVHLGTGNYNDRTARLYTDLCLMTTDEEIGADASGFFNAITGYSDPPDFQKLTMAPLGMRERFLHLILREADRARAGQSAMIQAKMNSLVDSEIIRALYEASRAGVLIKLAVRGICCLRPGIKGTSDRITVVSIVDRFLEHSRIFHFLNGGDEEFYCASADWMPRNLDRRVELLFPIQDEKGREKIRNIFQIFFADNVKARVLQADGSYAHKKRKKNEEIVRCQEALYQLAIHQRDQSRTLLLKPQSVPPA